MGKIIGAVQETISYVLLHKTQFRMTHLHGIGCYISRLHLAKYVRVYRTTPSSSNGGTLTLHSNWFWNSQFIWVLQLLFQILHICLCYLQIMFNESDKLMVSDQLFSMTIVATSKTLKFIHCEKITKFEKICHLFLKLFLIVETKQKISKFMQPSQNI